MRLSPSDQDKLLVALVPTQAGPLDGDHDVVRLHVAVRIEPCAEDDHVTLPSGHRVVGTVALLGIRDEPRPAGPGALRRASGPDLPPVEAALAATWDRWLSGTRAA